MLDSYAIKHLYIFAVEKKMISTLDVGRMSLGFILGCFLGLIILRFLIIKRLGLFVAAVLMSATVSFANNKKIPFSANTYQLSCYLQLTSDQVREVENINEYFHEMQKASLRASEDQKEVKMQKAIYSNLKLMKKVLNTEQYHKYVALINVTNNNNRLAGFDVAPDSYLADNK